MILSLLWNKTLSWRPGCIQADSQSTNWLWGHRERVRTEGAQSIRARKQLRDPIAQHPPPPCQTARKIRHTLGRDLSEAERELVANGGLALEPFWVQPRKTQLVLKGSHKSQIIWQDILQEHNIQMVFECNTTHRKHLMMEIQRKVIGNNLKF